MSALVCVFVLMLVLVSVGVSVSVSARVSVRVSSNLFAGFFLVPFKNCLSALTVSPVPNLLPSTAIVGDAPLQLPHHDG